MDKQQYVEEMLADMLDSYNINPDIIKQYAEEIIDGLDAWYELSGDSVASSNRYAALENEKIEAVKKKEKEIESIAKKHLEDIENWRRYNKQVATAYQNEIRDLKKQISGK